jgi:hypothetical protein
MPLDRVAVRRKLIEIAQRRHPLGTGSDLRGLMALPRGAIGVEPFEALGDITYAVVGGVATRRYMPERSTKDLDLLVAASEYVETCERLKAAGWTRERELLFPNTGLGLTGSLWNAETRQVDILTADRPWVAEALSASTRDENGVRVISLPFLVLMKLDSGRVQDTGDISRMLALAEEPALADTRAVVGRHAPDSEALEDLESLLEIGRWELK